MGECVLLIIYTRDFGFITLRNKRNSQAWAGAPSFFPCYLCFKLSDDFRPINKIFIEGLGSKCNVRGVGIIERGIFNDIFEHTVAGI